MRPRYHLLFIVLFFGVTPAFGGYIDFTVAPFDSSIDGQTSWTSPTVDGIEVTFTAHPDGATLYWDHNAGYKDGIGIRYSYENDEIESDEILEISFSESVLLSYVNLTDLFNEWGYLETGSYYYT